MKTKSVLPTETHKEFNDAMKEVLSRFKDRLDAESMLAIASHLVGVLVALQDQRKYSPEMVMKLVGQNIELGNAEALKEVQNPLGSA